jgi:glutaminase
VQRANSIAQRMLLEGVRRLHLDGHDVRIVDPWGVLGSAETGSGELVHGEQAHGGFVPASFSDVASAVRG